METFKHLFARLAKSTTLLLTCAFVLALLPIKSEAFSKTVNVTAIQNDLSEGRIAFSLSSKKTLAPPTFQYLPTMNGEILLVVDFPNLHYGFPTQFFHLSNEIPNNPHTYNGLTSPTSLNIGQFEINPPIFRLSFSAKSREALKGISFQSRPGCLMVSWPQGNSQESSKRTFPEDLLGNRKLQPQLINKPPYIQQTNPSEIGTALDYHLVFSTASLVQPPEITPSTETSPHQTANHLIDLSCAVEDTSSSVKVILAANDKLNFSSYRMHVPERYVFDFDNFSELSSCTPPNPGNNSLIKAIRLGTPQDKPQTSRLVIDLTDSGISLQQNLNNTANVLTLTLVRNSPAQFNSGNFADGLPGHSLYGHTIVLDAGHGGSDPGAQREGIQEKTVTLAIVGCLKKLLEEQGLRIVVTRADDCFVSLEDRVKLTNAYEPDLFLSVHINSLETDSNIQGIETYYQTPQSKNLAELIHGSLVNHLEVPDRNIRKAKFYVINHTEVPSVLAEVGFISSPDERNRLISSDYQFRIAKALEHGVILYLAKQYGQTSIRDSSRKQLAIGNLPLAELRDSLKQKP